LHGSGTAGSASMDQCSELAKQWSFNSAGHQLAL
jgi:hypothetical protein